LQYFSAARWFAMSSKTCNSGLLMSNEVLCLYGAGGHGRVIARQARVSGWSKVIFADATLPLGTSVAGSEVRHRLLQDVEADALLICIGDNSTRHKRQQEAVLLGLNLATLIVDPSRYFADPAGQGTVVLAGAIVNVDARIGNGVIVNSGAIVEHDVELGAFCHVAPGAVLGGASRLGEDSLLGTNATVLPGVAIGDRIVIGAGAVVTRDLTEPGIYAGTPARRIHSHDR
jgi:sugar O-acyltransferase (sialic acid O-acetyltransferase NeuD family)